MNKFGYLKTKFDRSVILIKKFASVIKLPWLCLIILAAYYFLSVLGFSNLLHDYFISQILNLGSYHFDAYWGERDWFVILKKSLFVINKIMASFSVLFFILYRYFKKKPDKQKNYLNQYIFDLFGLLYGFIYFNYVFLGAVFLFHLKMDYIILGLLSSQWLESYTYFASYQTIFGLISVNNFFILLFLFLN